MDLIQADGGVAQTGHNSNNSCAYLEVDVHGTTSDIHWRVWMLDCEIARENLWERYTHGSIRVHEERWRAEDWPHDMLRFVRLRLSLQSR